MYFSVSIKNWKPLTHPGVHIFKSIIWIDLVCLMTDQEQKYGTPLVSRGRVQLQDHKGVS